MPATAMREDEGNAGKGRVLVVDDDPELRQMVLYALQNRGYQADGAEDGLQALARLQRGTFDVVVTDFQMPRLDGLALLREVRRLEPPLPVVILTGFVDTSMEAVLRRAGAFRVLMKGGRLGDLVRTVEEACTVSKNPRAPRA